MERSQPRLLAGQGIALAGHRENTYLSNENWQVPPLAQAIQSTKQILKVKNASYTPVNSIPTIFHFSEAPVPPTFMQTATQREGFM